MRRKSVCKSLLISGETHTLNTVLHCIGSLLEIDVFLVRDDNSYNIEYSHMDDSNTDTFCK